MIRKAASDDMPRILEIFGIAREYMRQNGNPTQWGDSRPPADSVEKQLSLGNLYVEEKDGRVLGVCAVVPGDDEFYSYIEDGAWPDSDAYVTMHMTASSGETKGIFDSFFAFAKSFGLNVRIDTHENNAVMRHCIGKHGFVYCGRVYVSDGTPRMAFQWTRKTDGQGLRRPGKTPSLK